MLLSSGDSWSTLSGIAQLHGLSEEIKDETLTSLDAFIDLSVLTTGCLKAGFSGPLMLDPEEKER